MGLSEDLDKYAKEVYTKKDIKAGLKLLREGIGFLSLFGTLTAALFIWLPGVGVPISTALAAQVLRNAVSLYDDLSENERRNVRAAVSWIKGGVTLERFLG